MRKLGFVVPIAMPQTEREKWEAATAHIRKRYPSITWKDPITPEHTLNAMLSGMKLDFLERRH